MIKADKHRRNELAIRTLGANMRKYRKEKNLTMTELANKVGVDYSQISRMERGTINANISVVFDVAFVLEIPPGQLLEPLS